MVGWFLFFLFNFSVFCGEEKRTRSLSLLLSNIFFRFLPLFLSHIKTKSKKIDAIKLSSHNNNGSSSFVLLCCGCSVILCLFYFISPSSRPFNPSPARFDYGVRTGVVWRKEEEGDGMELTTERSGEGVCWWRKNGVWNWNSDVPWRCCDGGAVTVAVVEPRCACLNTNWLFFFQLLQFFYWWWWFVFRS